MRWAATTSRRSGAIEPGIPAANLSACPRTPTLVCTAISPS